MIALSVLIPAREEGVRLFQTVDRVHAALQRAEISHEFVIVNDTPQIDHFTRAQVKIWEEKAIQIQYLERHPPQKGFGTAVSEGMSIFKGKAIILLMADGSEDSEDIIRFYQKFEEGYDCVFGDRFSLEGRLVGYQKNKLFWNRFANYFLSFLFWIPYRDFTNAFKLYSRDAIRKIQPLSSDHFNITIELSLKAFILGLNIAVVPNSWRAQEGERASYLQIRAMGKKYFYTAMKIFYFKWATKLGGAS